MIKTLQELSKDTRGAGFVEYIILVGLVALFCIGAYTVFGGAVDERVRNQAQQVTGIGAQAAP